MLFQMRYNELFTHGSLREPVFQSLVLEKGCDAMNITHLVKWDIHELI